MVNSQRKTKSRSIAAILADFTLVLITIKSNLKRKYKKVPISIRRMKRRNPKRKQNKFFNDVYLILHVLLLADVFENFRKRVSWTTYSSTCIITLPGFTFDACFKFTEQELDLFTDSEKLFFIVNSIRGGISVVCLQHAKANKSLVSDYDPNTTLIFDLCRW